MGSIADLMMQGVTPDDPAAAAPAPAATPPSLSSMMMEDVSKPVEPMTTRTAAGKGAGTDYMAALNKGLASAVGAPVDLATWALNQIPGVDIQHPLGGSEDIAKTMGTAGIDTEPTPGTLATAAGEGTAGMVGFEAAIRSGARKAAEAIPYVGKIASKVGDAIESALGPGKVTSTLAAGAAGAAGGAGGQALESTVPEGSPWGPVLNTIGNIAGGAPIAGLELGAKQGAGLLKELWAREGAPFFKSGQQRMAADIVKNSMTDPGKAIAALDEPSLTNLTTFQKTGDMKLGQLERNSAVQRPEEFKAVNAQQNEQRVAHINAQAAEGQPAAVGEFFTQQLRGIDDLGQQAEDLTAAHLANTRGAQADALTDVGGTRHPNAEAYGAEERDTLQGLADTEKARVSGLWNAAVGDGSLTFYSQPLKDMSASLQADVRPTQRPPTGEEKSIYDAIDALPDNAPFLGAKDLRSRISAEIRQQIRSRGTTEAEEVARLLQAKNGLDGALEDSITAQAAREQQSVSAGILNPEEAMYRRLLAEAENYKLSSNVNPDGTATARSGAGSGRDTGAPASPLAGNAGAAGAPRGGSAAPPGGAGAAQEANLTQEDLDAYARARQGTFNYKRTYRSGPVGDVLAPGPAGYKAGNGAVMAKFFNGSDTSPAAIDALIAAHGGDRAAAIGTLSDYAAFDMRRVAAPNGVVNPTKLASWMTKHQAALSALPELRDSFSTLERATATMQAAEAHTVEAAQLHRQAMHQFETSAAKHFLGRDPDVAIASAFKSANPAQTLRELVRMAAADPSGAATEGLKRSVVEHILKTYSSSAEAGSSGVAQLKFDGLSKFIGKQEGALRAVLGDNGYKNLQDVVADMQKANRSVSATKIPGGSNTPQDLAGHRRFGKLTTLIEHLATEAGGAAAGMHFAGPLGGIMGFFAGRAFSSARKGAMQAVTDLVIDAMLYPKVAKELLTHVSPQQVKSGALGQFYSRLVGLGMPKPFAAGGRAFPPGFAGGGLAGQTLVGPDATPPDDAAIPVRYRNDVGQAQANEFWDQANDPLAGIKEMGLAQQSADQAMMREFKAKQAHQPVDPADQGAILKGPLAGFALGLSGPIPEGGLATGAGEAAAVAPSAGGLATEVRPPAPGGLAAAPAHDTGAPYGQAPEALAAPAGSAPSPHQGPVPGGRGELPGSPGGMGPQDRTALAAPAPLEGLPSRVKIHNDRELPDWMGGQREFEAGPNTVARKVASDYMAKTGLDTKQPTQYLKVDPARGARIAQAFDEMKHDPSDPLVKAAYEAMAKETMAQWKQIKKTGLKTEFIKPGDPDPYHASPRLAAEDVKRNNHLYVFPTDSGYGTTGITPEAIAENPLLAATREKIGGQPARINDIFRVVHDYFGHIKEGVGFRAEGEENAWNSHARMYSPLARLAMTSETRGQNSWVNWGPHGEANRTASSPDTAYADQKIGILPDWAMSEGAEGVPPVNTADMRKMLAGPRYPAADDPGNIGSAKQLYHGTAGDFDKLKTRPGDVGVHLGTVGQANDRLAFKAQMGTVSEGENIRPVLADIKNPLRMDDLGNWDSSNMNYALRNQFPELMNKPFMTMPQIRSFIKGKGYDGIVYKNTGETAGASELFAKQQALFKKAQKEVGFKNSVSVEQQKHPAYREFAKARTALENYTAKNAEDSYIALKPDQIRSGVGAQGPRSAEDVMAEKVGLPHGDKIRGALEDAKAAVANTPDTGLFDLRRDTLAQTPDVMQRELPRYEPQHGVSERMTDMMNREDVRDKMLGGIGAGVEQGSAGWYNTDQLRQAFQQELGDRGDAAYKRFLDYVSGASPRSNVVDNIRNASFQHYLEMQGHHPNDVNPFPYPYGHLAQNLHRMNAAKIRGGGYNLFDNPKPPSFAANLGGNWRPGTMDAHAMRAVGMHSEDPRFLASQLRVPLGKDLAGKEQFQNLYPRRMFERGEIDMPKALATPGYWSSQPNPNEYKALEHYFRGLGREYELDTAPTQAAAWTGHGKMTGLGTEPLPFMALFDKVLNRTAYARGEEPKETLRRFIRGEAPLYEEGGTVHENGLASAGEPAPGGLASGGRALKAAFHEVYHDTPAIVKHTAAKFGAEDARKQRVAIALSKARKAGADV